MLTTIGDLFIRLTGTLAVLIVVAFLVVGTDLMKTLDQKSRRWRSWAIPGLMGGVFGIYGNLGGVNLNGAVVSIRDIGPMIAGLTGGPMGGLMAGIIAGVHRLTLGGITAPACIIATCLIGLFCGLLSRKFPEQISKPSRVFLLGVLMEVMHLSIVLLIVRPFETAWGIVETIALPFVLINGVGFALVVFFMNTIDKQKHNEQERSRIKSELEVAARIQKSLLPMITDRFREREEIEMAASMNAAKEVGGDFYDFYFIDNDQLALVIADVSGKGIPAALFMANAKSTIQNCIREIPDLAAAVGEANHRLSAHNDEEMFVTAWIGILDLTSGSIRFVSAGHNPPVIISGDYVCYVKMKNGFVLGGFDEFVYQENEIYLKPGDKLYLYTDGVTEAENPAHEQFGENRLQASLSKAQEQSPEDILKQVGEDMEAFVNGADQFDDVTMLCLEYRAH